MTELRGERCGLIENHPLKENHLLARASLQGGGEEWVDRNRKHEQKKEEVRRARGVKSTLLYNVFPVLIPFVQASISIVLAGYVRKEA